MYDAVSLIDLAVRIAVFRQASENALKPFLRLRSGMKAVHWRMRLSHSRVTASRSLRRSAAETSQYGFSKLSAVSTMM